MKKDDLDQTVPALVKWFRKPLRNWWYLIDFSIAVIGVGAAFMTQIWWLLFIPAFALMESVCVLVAGIFCDVIEEKDTENVSLRRQLNALLSEIA